MLVERPASPQLASEPGRERLLTPRRQALTLDNRGFLLTRLRLPLRYQWILSARHQDDLPGLRRRFCPAGTFRADLRPSRERFLAHLVRLGPLCSGSRHTALAACDVPISPRRNSAHSAE